MQGSTAVKKVACVVLTTLVLAGTGCGLDVFNSAFINTLIGGQVPVTPGPLAKFVFVRCVNETDEPVEFIVTIERSVVVTDAEGHYQLNEDGDPITRAERETVRLQTLAEGNARELGTLFPCGESPVTHVGLGEDLLPTDAAIYVGGQGTGGVGGFGVPAGDLYPLQYDELEDGNFHCGDTIIFRAYRVVGVAGGTALQAFLLRGSEQPSSFGGPSTFENLEQFLESQVREAEP